MHSVPIPLPLIPIDPGLLFSVPAIYNGNHDVGHLPGGPLQRSREHMCEPASSVTCRLCFLSQDFTEKVICHDRYC